MLTLDTTSIPDRLTRIASPPKQLFVAGDLDAVLARPSVAIVGSRKVSNYGRQVTQQLATELARRGVVIVSGLAFGVDSIAHQAALEAGGLTLAVLPSPLEAVYPASHRPLATRILESGGALVSEYPAGTVAFKGNFVARNRLIAGLADAVLITEAALKSGSLHTARFALNAGREVFSVPGNITSPTSEGTNNLIRSGALPVTSVDDIFVAMDWERQAPQQLPQGDTAAEQAILDLIGSGEQEGNVLQLMSGLNVEEYNQALTMLEINGKIRSLGADRWSF